MEHGDIHQIKHSNLPNPLTSTEIDDGMKISMRCKVFLNQSNTTPQTSCLHTYESNQGSRPPPIPCSEIKLNCFPWLKPLPSDWHVVAETSILWQAEYFYRAIKVKLCVWNEKWACWYPSLIGKRKRKTAPDLLLDLNTNSCLLCCHGYSLNSMRGDKAHPTLLLEAGAVLHQWKTKHLRHREHQCLFGRLRTD